MERADKWSRGPQLPAYHLELPAVQHLAYLQAQHCRVAGSARKGVGWAERLRAGRHLCLCLWGWLWQAPLAAGGLCRDGHTLDLGSGLRARRGLQAEQTRISARGPSCTGPCKPCWGVVTLQAKPVRLGPPEMVTHWPGQQRGGWVQQVRWQSRPCCAYRAHQRQPPRGLSHRPAIARVASTGTLQGISGRQLKLCRERRQRCRCTPQPPDSS